MNEIILPTVFLRLEGPLQAWGDSKMVIRDTFDEPTKSGVLGLICCAKGVRRAAARDELKRLNELVMGVRVDRPGIRWHDYHTAGAGYGILNAKGEVKKTASTGEYETLISRRYYLADASFLVALQGPSELICEVLDALAKPDWVIYLGRKSCPPTRPILLDGKYDGDPLGDFPDVRTALTSRPWRPRFAGDDAPYDASPQAEQTVELDAVLEWRPTNSEPHVPTYAEPWQDVAVALDPPVHHPRYVVRTSAATRLSVPVGKPTQTLCPAPHRPRADYKNKMWQKVRDARREMDNQLCVFCKAPGGTVQHVTYRHAGGGERLDELRTLCRLCHDAVTMIEYGQGMGLDRINPEELRWRDAIIAKRDEIIRFRSLATRRRRLQPEEVE